MKAIRLNELLQLCHLESKSAAHLHKRNSALVYPAVECGRGDSKKLSRFLYCDQPAFGSGLHFYATSSVFRESQSVSAERMVSSGGMAKAGRLTVPAEGGQSPRARKSLLSE